MQLQKNKGKIVFLVKRELPFPDIWIFKKLNRIYWWIIFNFFVLKTIKRHSKKNNFLVICDFENYGKIKKLYPRTRMFDDYIKVPKIYSDPYIKTIKLAKKLFSQFYCMLEFGGYNLGKYVEEEFAYDAVSIVDEFEVMREISRKEGAEEFIVIEKEGAYAKIASLFGGIKTIRYLAVPDFILKIKRRIRNYSLEIRALLSFAINNREFTRTGNSMGGRNKKILFAAFDKSDLLRMLPLIELARKKNKEFVVLSNYNDARKVLEEKKMPYVFFGDFLDKNDREVILKKKEELVEKWKAIKAGYKKKLLYEGYNLWEVLEPQIEYQFYTRFPWIMHYILASRKILQEGIRIIITTGDMAPRGRSLIMTGREYGIPSLLLQEGATCINDTPRGFIPLLSDKIAVWGQSAREYFRDYKVDPKRIVATGCAQFDTYAKPKKADPLLYDKLGIEKNSRFFVVATQPSDCGYFMDKERVKLVNEAINAMEYFPDFKLVIKLHPREKENAAWEILRNLDNWDEERCRIIRDVDIDELIRASEMVITVTSTAAIDTMLLGVPVINVDIFNCRKEIGMFGKFNAGIIARNKEDLAEAMTKALSKEYRKKYEKNRKRFLEWYLHKMDGKSSERILNLIEEMTGKK